MGVAARAAVVVKIVNHWDGVDGSQCEWMPAAAQRA